MAGDWIKMRVGLTTSPKVMRIAECLLENGTYLEWSALSYGMGGYPPMSDAEARSERHAALRVTRYVTVTALLRFWGYANEHIKGEFVAGIFPADVDEIVGVPGFADAIEAAGWAEFEPDGGMTLPNFCEHNTSAGERSSGAERQKRYRERKLVEAKSDGVTRDVTVTPREEKKREEKKEQKQKQPPAAPVSVVPDPPDWVNREAWEGFVAMRRSQRHPLTPRAAKLVLTELTKLRADGNDPNAVLDQSTRNGWRDVFPLRKDRNQPAQVAGGLVL